MTIKQAWIAALAAAAVISVIGVGVHFSTPDLPQQPSNSNEVVTESSVAAALTENKCTFLTKSGDDGGIHTVVLMSRTGVMAGATLPNAVLSDLVDTAGGDGTPVGSLTLITVGGGTEEQPRVVLNRAALSDPKAGSARAARLGEHLPQCLTAALQATAGPQQAGSDELRAQQVAARAADTRVVVVSDGEANTGLLDLRAQAYPYGDPAAAAGRVDTAGQLPDFANLDVTYYGIGQNRSEAERSWLATFYGALCAAAGGTCIIAKDLVPVAATTSHAAPDDPPLRAITPVSEGPTNVYRVDSASFRANSTALVEPAAVMAALREIVDYATRAQAQSVHVYGHACDDGSPPDTLVGIAEDRAQMIADLLRDLGLEATVTHEGLGAQNPVAGPDADGTFTTAQCAANRRVEIVVG